jgi:ABC-type phosphate transport system permease subunit
MEIERPRKRGGGIGRAVGSVFGVVGSLVVGIAVGFGALVYLVVAWGQHRRRGSGRAS